MTESSHSPTETAAIASEARRHMPLRPRHVWRPDSRLSEDIAEKLALLTHAETDKVRFRVTFGKVVLTGRVDDPRLADLAVSAVKSVWGIQGLRNEIAVRH